jgi:predicted HTH domain antitoxin
MIMQITIEVPDELAERLLGNQHSPLSRQVLEVLAVEAYKADRLTSAEVGRILGLSRWEVDAFLKQHQAYLHYDETDLEQDIETLSQLRNR